MGFTEFGNFRIISKKTLVGDLFSNIYLKLKTFWDNALSSKMNNLTLINYSSSSFIKSFIILIIHQILSREKKGSWTTDTILKNGPKFF